MIIIVCLLFAISFFFSIISIPYRLYKIGLFVFLGFILITVAGLRKEGVDRDYANYKDAFEGTNLIGFAAEPSFAFICWIIKVFLNNNVIFLFVIYALIGVFIKFYAIKQLTEFWFLSICIYISYLYTLQELTQIRVGVATGILLLSIKPLYDRKFLIFFVLSILAFLFHFSTFFIVILWFLDHKKINTKLWFFLILFSCLFGIALKDYFAAISSVFALGPLENKVLAYQFDNNSLLNVFNVWQLLRCGLSFLFLYKIDLLQKNNLYSIILVKIYVLATCVFFLLSFNPAFSGRISDVLAVVDIVLIPFLIYVFKPQFFAKTIVFLIGLAYLFLNLFFNKILI